MTDNDAAKALTQITVRGRQGHDDHDFAGCSDVERSLASYSVDCPAEAGYDVAERAIIDVKDARPRDRTLLEVQLVSLVEVIVNHCGQEIVCRGDCVEVSGQVQIHLLEWQYLALTAARCSSFDAESRAH